jgi:radical SAM protein with 4Fe4S-binding SPASM domain
VTKSVYSTSKPIHHTDRMESLRSGKQPYPVHVEIIISDFCNHDCGFCAYRMSGYTSNQLFQIDEGQSRKARNPRRMIPKEKVFEILDDCKKMDVKAIQFTGGGEPTVHPDFVEIAKYAQDLGFDTALITNGNMLHRSDHREVIRNMTWIRVSIDAANAYHYSEERGVGAKSWDRMLSGVRSLVEEVGYFGERPIIGAGFVVTPRNWTQIHDAVKLYKEVGFDNVRLGLMFNPDNADPFEDCKYDMNYLALKAVEDFRDNEFSVINRVSEKHGELEKGTPDFEFCSYQHFTTYIGGDLNVYRCCVYAYNLHGLVGSLEKQSFKQMWDSKHKHDDFDKFNPQECERCQFTEIIENTNKQINSNDPLPVGEDPVHVNFT